MDHSAISLDLNKDDAGFLKGFSLTAVETWAECFCVTFPFAQAKGKASVEFADGKIRFVHNGISSDETPSQLGIYGSSEAGVYEADIGLNDAATLEDLLEKRGQYEGANLKIQLERAWGKGFSLRAELPAAA